MFEIFDSSQQKYPIKVWLEKPEQVDEVCMQQSLNLSNLPFIHKWVALMPDTHQGFGMPIGGVVALKGHLIPNAVGVDIGCGIAYVQTDLKLGTLTRPVQEQLIREIMVSIPVGFSHRETAVESGAIEQFIEVNKDRLCRQKQLMDEVQRAKYQLGTLGGGNHFIELQKDAEENISIMVHSGSRHFGYQVAQHFDEKAALYCRKMGDKKIHRQKLAYLPADHDSGKDYLAWMSLAMLFAAENRRIMMSRVQEILLMHFPDVTFQPMINVHHNYAALETHYGETVWVHRKGAIRAGLGEVGIIPGAMGTSSYIVAGKGEPMSFESCSHGAGRHSSRKQALKTHSKQEVLEDLKSLNVSLGTTPESLIADESRFAYKDISFVLSQQQDLVSITKELKTVMVVKG